MYSNAAKPLKTAAGAALLAITMILGLGCGDASNPGSKPDPKNKDWRVSNWTKPDTSGYVTFNNGGIKIEMVLVKGGTFTMGCTMPEEELCDFDEGGFVTRRRCDGGMLQNLCAANEYPAHKVTVSDFYIGKFEVTNELWIKVMDRYPEWYYDDGLLKKIDNLINPLYAVRHLDSASIPSFLNKLNKLTNKNYRLPTEAEWEFAARGGNNSKNRAFAGSDNVEQVNGYGPMGTSLPNELGIYSMTGNVAELVSDWYSPYTAKSQANPQGPLSGEYRITRGGYSSRQESYLRVSSRVTLLPNEIDDGIRLVLNAN